jgi:hypothetical protein
MPRSAETRSANRWLVEHAGDRGASGEPWIARSSPIAVAYSTEAIAYWRVRAVVRRQLAVGADAWTAPAAGDVAEPSAQQLAEL